MADKTSINSLANDIIQVGAYKSLVSEYETELNVDKEYYWNGWRAQRLETNPTFATNFYGGTPDSKFHDPSTYQQFKHFWHCVFDDPIEFASYWLGRTVLIIKSILRVTIISTIGIYAFLLLTGAYLNVNGAGMKASNLGVLMIRAFIVGFVVTLIMFILVSATFRKKVFKTKFFAPLWLTIWHREASSWVAYDFRFDCFNGHPLDQLLGDGVALLSDYSKNELDMAYAHLNYLERFLILPDTAEHQLFSEPLSAKDEIDLKHATKQGQIRQELHDKLLQQVTTFNKKEA